MRHESDKMLRFFSSIAASGIILVAGCQTISHRPRVSADSGTIMSGGINNGTNSGLSRGTLLENLTWTEAESRLNKDAIVVIPLGASAKEHGPHLTLQNDFLIAEYLKNEILKSENVLIAPTVNYGYYPAFVEYPGTVSLRMETTRDLIVDICRSYARFGVHRFYVINTGLSTLKALKPAAELLSQDGISLRYTNLKKAMDEVEARVAKQAGGSHADEIETSMMMIMAPETVQMSKAVKDFNPGEGPLTRDPENKAGAYSPTGSWGDPTLATPEKGRILVDTLVSAIKGELREFGTL